MARLCERVQEKEGGMRKGNEERDSDEIEKRFT
jgi:hypothetical protein